MLSSSTDRQMARSMPLALALKLKRSRSYVCSKAFLFLYLLTAVTGVCSVRGVWTDSSTLLPEYLDGSFLTSLTTAVNQVNTVQRPFLIHTQEDLLLVNEDGVTNLSISATVYENLKATSHLPVTAVTLLLPDLLSSNGSLSSSQLTSSTRQSLTDFQSLLRNLSTMNYSDAFSSPEQYTRQSEIVGTVLDFVDQVLTQPTNITTDRLTAFVQSLTGQLNSNAQDAVRDYLRCLNEAVMQLVGSESVLTKHLVVVLSTGPFSARRSFLVQYYQQLLNISANPGSERLVLSAGREGPRNNTNTTDTTSTCWPSQLTLFQSLSKLFYNDSFSSLHSSLSTAATGVICSDDLILSTCINESVITDNAVEGFSTRFEKSYVTLMMFFGGLAVLFGIVLSCITYEDRLMSLERRSQESERKFKLDGPNVFTPITSIQESSQSVQHSTENSSYQRLLTSDGSTN